MPRHRHTGRHLHAAYVAVLVTLCAGCSSNDEPSDTSDLAPDVSDSDSDAAPQDTDTDVVADPDSAPSDTDADPDGATPDVRDPSDAVDDADMTDADASDPDGSDADSVDTDTAPPKVSFLRGRNPGPQDGLTWETAFTHGPPGLALPAGGTLYVEEGCCLPLDRSSHAAWPINVQVFGGRRAAEGSLTGTDPGIEGPIPSNFEGPDVNVQIGVSMRNVAFGGGTSVLLQVGSMMADDFYASGARTFGECGGLIGAGVRIGELTVGDCARHAFTNAEGPYAVQILREEGGGEIARYLPSLHCPEGQCFLSRTMVGSGTRPTIGPKLVATIIDPDQPSWVSFRPVTTPELMEMVHYVLEAPAINGPYTVLARDNMPVQTGGASERFHLPDPEKFYALAWSPLSTLNNNERYDEGLSGQVLGGLGTTAGLIVASYPAGGHQVGATINPDVLLYDRVQQMDVTVFPPPQE